MDGIIAATNVPYRLHKDIAQQYRVTSQLVGVLARLEKKEPKKFEILRLREAKQIEKKEAIEATAARMLASN